jgi:transcriptional regulator with XRE-family HTH domain
MPSKSATTPRTARPKQKPSAVSTVRAVGRVDSAPASGFGGSIEGGGLAIGKRRDSGANRAKTSTKAVVAGDRVEPPPAPLDAVELEPEPEREPARIARSEGQELLLAVPDSLQQVSDAIGITRAAVSLWRNGARVPEETHRRKLYARYSIPPASWDRVPGDMPPSSSEPAAAWFPDAGDAASPLDDCNRLLALLRSQLNRTDLIGRERVQLGDAFSRALAQKERLERARETLEARTIREHPEWRRMKRLMIKALIPYPEAAQAVEAAILAVLGDETAERGEGTPNESR